MNYNDFPILNDDAYDFLKEKFNEQAVYERTSSVASIFNNLNFCVAGIRGVMQDVNKEICLALKFAETELIKILENLSENFNMKTQAVEIRNFNLFAIIKRLNLASKENATWCKHEKKEYLSQLAFGNLKDLLEVQNKILEAIEKSNVRIFKFM